MIFGKDIVPSWRRVAGSDVDSLEAQKSVRSLDAEGESCIGKDEEESKEMCSFISRDKLLSGLVILLWVAFFWMMWQVQRLKEDR